MQMRIVFNSFRKILVQIGPDDCGQYALQMLTPLYKVCEGFSGKTIDGEFGLAICSAFFCIITSYNTRSSGLMFTSYFQMI